jgi:hypothetical protein
MGAWHESEEMPSMDNSTTITPPMGKPATGRPKAPVQIKGTVNVLLNILIWFFLCITSAEWKDNLLVHFAQMHGFFSVCSLDSLSKVVLDNKWLWTTC